jgi:hypothetical protein
VPFWFALATAHLAAGNEEEAARYFRRIAESTTERVRHPLPCVRSFYFLGKLHEKRGETDKAPEYYRPFIGFWKDTAIWTAKGSLRRRARSAPEPGQHGGDQPWRAQRESPRGIGTSFPG